MLKDKKNTAIYIAYEDDKPIDFANAEKNLLRAILLSAMSDIKRTGEAGRKAKEFFLSSDENYVFSFRSICDHLEIDRQSVLTVVGLRPPSTERDDRSRSN